jgi:hypothetical protein
LVEGLKAGVRVVGSLIKHNLLAFRAGVVLLIVGVGISVHARLLGHPRGRSLMPRVVRGVGRRTGPSQERVVLRVVKNVAEEVTVVAHVKSVES